MKAYLTIVAVALALLGRSPAQDTKAADRGGMESIHRPDQIKWKDGPASLPPGAKFAVLEGDTTKEGPFTMRVLLPDGFRIPPHTHPNIEHVTVISGLVNFGMGEKFDKSATQPMPAGTFGFWPAGMKHFVWTTGETIVQVHGIGPWRIDYLNPADDPRNATPAKK
jgi:quercetin dioxygenase-like cupin family protein